MKILVLNAGSSSLKYSVFEGRALEMISSGLVEKIGDKGESITHKYLKGQVWEKVQLQKDIKNHRDALEVVVSMLMDSNHGIIKGIDEISIVGHRVVHGGEDFSKPQLVDERLKQKVMDLIPLAPLHNPANLLGIEVSEEVFPEATQVAVFDTAFHQTLPEYAFRYALPGKLYDKFGIRVYGMHGTSHQYVTEEASEYLKKDLGTINLITIHLGNGCSMCAVKGGNSVDTSLGLSPLPGLVMGTRSGDIDPTIIFQLIREHGYSYEQVENLLNKESGLKGLTGLTDMRDILQKKDDSNESTQLALDIYCYRIKKYIGSYLAVVGSIDAIVFTAGVGENAAYIRSKCLEGLEHLGIKLDQVKNEHPSSGINEIQDNDSSVTLLVIPTNEEKQIAQSALELNN